MKGYVVREEPRRKRNHFNYGCGIWNGARFDSVSIVEFKSKEVADIEEFEGRPIPPRVVKIEFLPQCPSLPESVASFGLAMNRRRLMERLKKDESYRHQMRSHYKRNGWS
jgi:hypothetical protein